MLIKDRYIINGFNFYHSPIKTEIFSLVKIILYKVNIFGIAHYNYGLDY